MRISRIIYFLLFLTLSFSVSAKKKSGGIQKVYIFGFASSFTDSLAFMTDVQELDSAYVLNNGFLADRALYSLQFYGHVNEKRGVENPTAAVFFDVKPQKLAKKYEKVKRMYQKDPNVRLVIVGKEEFGFTAEEYAETLMVEVSEEEAAAVTEGRPADDGKKDKKKKKEGRK